MMTCKVLLLPGDHIGPEIMAVAERVLNCVCQHAQLDIELAYGEIGGSALDRHGHPYPERTRQQAERADAILLGAVGGPEWEHLPRMQRPERGLLAIRAHLGLFANLRPAVSHAELGHASSLKASYLEGLDVLIVRELTGGIYFGQPRGIHTDEQGRRYGVNTYRYDEAEIIRIARVAFSIAMRRNQRVCSIDKANVLEVTELWREVVTQVGRDEFPDVELTHMYVDNAAMQLVKAPQQFDVILTGNLFGDILSDLAAMLTGSIGMLPSASVEENNKGLYEPCHGSAPDISGQGLANPLAMVLSTAMMLRMSLQRDDLALKIERAVQKVLAAGVRTADIASAGMRTVSTADMGHALEEALAKPQGDLRF